MPRAVPCLCPHWRLHPHGIQSSVGAGEEGPKTHTNKTMTNLQMVTGAPEGTRKGPRRTGIVASSRTRLPLHQCPPIQLLESSQVAVSSSTHKGTGPRSSNGSVTTPKAVSLSRGCISALRMCQKQTFIEHLLCSEDGPCGCTNAAVIRELCRPACPEPW